MQQPIAPLVDLSQISILTEIIIRAGNVADPQNRPHTKAAYEPDPRYSNDVIGLSVVFRSGATLDELARTASYPNSKIGYTSLGVLAGELATINCGFLLFVTPTVRFPDHHTLAFTRGDVVEQTLADDMLDALIRALLIVDNPYKSSHP
jgi:hypothetical protein